MGRGYQVMEFAHKFIKEQVQPGDICIDATAGNGNDTEFLCTLVGENGRVYAFDIQKEALERTKDRLEKKNLSNRATLLLCGHEKMKEKIEECKEQKEHGNQEKTGEISCIVFNFGYLPGGDHTLGTKAETSICAISQGLSLLKKGGMMSLCIYSGGDTGFEEKNAILHYIKTLDSKKYLVICSWWYNRENHPPIPVQIYKL